MARRPVGARVDRRLVRQVLHERRDRRRERLRRERAVRARVAVRAEARAARRRRGGLQRRARAAARITRRARRRRRQAVRVEAPAASARAAAISQVPVARSRGRLVARVRAAAVALRGPRAVAAESAGRIEAKPRVVLLNIVAQLIVQLRLVCGGRVVRVGRVKLRVVPGICKRSVAYRVIIEAATGSE